MPVSPESLITVGAVSGVYGVKGWVRVHSHTDPVENILEFPRWFICRGDDWQALELVTGRRQGKGLVAALAGIDDRDTARTLIGAEIAVLRDELPPPDEGEYYWIDLEGLRVETIEGRELGVVDHLFATGANDVMVVRGERERLVPFVLDEVITDVDFQAGVIRVDWDPDF